MTELDAFLKGRHCYVMCSQSSRLKFLQLQEKEVKGMGNSCCSGQSYSAVPHI